MKRIEVIAAGLGWRTLERSGSTEIAGMRFVPKKSCFPAVTCVAQADLRTGLTFERHGMIANGWWNESLRKPLFWEQSARLVKGRRIWEDRREAGGTVGLFFFQQSLGEVADVIVSPAPIHKHGGGMVMATYTKPTELESEILKRAGSFPLWRYWGPLASPKVGRKCIDYFKAAVETSDVDEAYLYLPTLDYYAQKYGPDSSAQDAAFGEFRRQLETLADFAESRGAELSVQGDYEITKVVSEPMKPNVLLRERGFFRVRKVGDRTYPDFYESTAFAMCDHEYCVVCGERAEEAVGLLLASGMERKTEGRDGIVFAPRGSWCDYRWWTDAREAPDFASHVDIHNKPGFDPSELFFFGRGVVRGTHGHGCEVASTRVP